MFDEDMMFPFPAHGIYKFVRYISPLVDRSPVNVREIWPRGLSLFALAVI